MLFELKTKIIIYKSILVSRVYMNFKYFILFFNLIITIKIKCKVETFDDLYVYAGPPVFEIIQRYLFTYIVFLVTTHGIVFSVVNY